jgi:hypothetical protein
MTSSVFTPGVRPSPRRDAPRCPRAEWGAAAPAASRCSRTVRHTARGRAGRRLRPAGPDEPGGLAMEAAAFRAASGSARPSSPEAPCRVRCRRAGSSARTPDRGPPLLPVVLDDVEAGAPRRRSP